MNFFNGETKMKALSFAAVCAAAMLATTSASAHTTSLGYVPGTSAGNVTFWTGSYEHGGTVNNEGVFTLQGITNPLYLSVVGANVAPTNTRPAGLVNGTNNFFWAQSGGGYSFPNSTDPNLFGGVVHWQGINFTGLAAGVYSFTCGTTCGSTQQWASLSTAGGQNGAVQITLTAGDVSGGGVGAVPEPATWAMMIVGFGLVGVSMRSAKRRSDQKFDAKIKRITEGARA